METLLADKVGGTHAHRSSQERAVCEGCVMGKFARPPFPTSESQSYAPLELVHTDLCGPMGVPSIGNAKYMFLLVDDYSRYSWAFFLSKKSQTLETFKKWQVLIERQLDHTLKILRSDNGGEFCSTPFEDHLRSLGVVHQTTIPYSSQQNGVVERANRTIVERTIALMHSEQIPLRLWAETMSTVVYLKNRSPSVVLNDRTPYEALKGRSPNLDHLRVVGCAAWVMIRKEARESKLHPRAVLCVMIGYSETQKGWKVWDPAQNRIIVARDVQFDESHSAERLLRPKVSFELLRQTLTPVDNTIEPATSPVTFNGSAPFTPSAHGVSTSRSMDLVETVGEVMSRASTVEPSSRQSSVEPPTVTQTVGATATRSPPQNDCSTVEAPAEPSGTVGAEQSSAPSQSEQPSSVDPQPTSTSDTPSGVSLNRPTKRPRMPKGWYLSDEAPPLPEPPPREPPNYTTRSGRAVHRPVTFDNQALIIEEDDDAQARYITERDDFLGRPDCPTFSPSDPRLPDWPSQLSILALAMKAISELDPQTFAEAISSPASDQWKTAMAEEMRSLIKAKVFISVNRSDVRKKILTGKWVFRIKHDSTGSIDRYKARWVARGFEQRAGIDFEETFAPVAKFQSIRIIIALASMFDLELHQMDVKTAFLYGDLTEEVYMEIPDGYRVDRSKVWKLVKSLYGLKQAPRAWYYNIHQTLLKLGFTRAFSDTSIYSRRDKRGLIIVGLYVDDLTIAASNISIMVDFKREMTRVYEMKDLGELQFILGLQVVRDRKARTIHLHQEQYIKKILARFEMTDTRHYWTPMPEKKVLSPRTPDQPSTDTATYLSMLGSLMYAMIGTRPDLAYAVGMLGRFSHDPSLEHRKAMDQVFNYLRGTTTLGVVFGPRSSDDHPDIHQLVGYCDADYATNDVSRRRVTSGFIFKLWGGAISWQSKRQPSVTLATAEAEYVAMSQASKEFLWIRSLLTELGYRLTRPIILHGDNQAAIAIGRNPTAHSRAKHIDIVFHHIRELVERKLIELEYLKTDSMIADGLTKPLGRIKYNRFVQTLGLSDTLVSNSSLSLVSISKANN